MAEYHVGCGLAAIYAGRLNKNKTMWLDGKCDVTDEAICSVRDYLVDRIEDGQNTFGYQWDRKDGKIVTLKVEVSNG